MMLIADSGATKTTWRMYPGEEALAQWTTEGISPYFFTAEQVTLLLQEKLLPMLPEMPVEVFFYGTGCATETNQQLVASGLRGAFGEACSIAVASDMMAAARALCGRSPGVACILGTGSNSCFYNGQSIVRNNPAPGFILGDEGSGAYLGKKLVQYFIYQTFDEDLMHKFKLRFQDDYRTILDKVYKQPWPNRYLASFAPFLSENRGHYMIENIIEDGLNDFFYNHIYKYPEAWNHPLHFVGSVAWHFRDVLAQICAAAELELGTVLQQPMPGLLQYHAG